MWGVVKDFQIACNFTGPLGDRLSAKWESGSQEGDPRTAGKVKKTSCPDENKQRRVHRGFLFGQSTGHWET